MIFNLLTCFATTSSQSICPIKLGSLFLWGDGMHNSFAIEVTLKQQIALRDKARKTSDVIVLVSKILLRIVCINFQLFK